MSAAPPEFDGAPTQTIPGSEALEQISATLLAGVQSKTRERPWRMPWHGIAQMPTNPRSGRHFQGVNIMCLWAASKARRYTKHYWASPNFWRSRGAYVPDGKEIGVEIWRPVFDESQAIAWTAETLRASPAFDPGPVGGDPTGGIYMPVAGYEKATVVNVSECRGGNLPPMDSKPSTPAIVDAAEAVIRGYLSNRGPLATIGGISAQWNAGTDTVTMPPREAFQPHGDLGAEQYYYATYFHELGHSTASPNRLNRKTGSKKDSRTYAEEELTAELIAAMLGSVIGLATELRSDHEAYLQHWLAMFQGDLLPFMAATKKAVLGTHHILEKAGMADRFPQGAEAVRRDRFRQRALPATPAPA